MMPQHFWLISDATPAKFDSVRDFSVVGKKHNCLKLKMWQAATHLFWRRVSCDRCFVVFVYRRTPCVRRQRVRVQRRIMHQRPAEVRRIPGLPRFVGWVRLSHARYKQINMTSWRYFTWWLVAMWPKKKVLWHNFVTNKYPPIIAS